MCSSSIISVPSVASVSLFVSVCVCVDCCCVSSALVCSGQCYPSWCERGPALLTGEVVTAPHSRRRGLLMLPYASLLCERPLLSVEHVQRYWFNFRSTNSLLHSKLQFRLFHLWAESNSGISPVFQRMSGLSPPDFLLIWAAGSDASLTRLLQHGADWL